tara:strand:- start:4770 stop:6056 length:1287 start_codon:yes stop_codon:yes gene_type:complete
MSFYEFNEEDKVNKKSQIRQLVDILAVDIAGKDSSSPAVDTKTRKKYEVFVTASASGTNPVTSSLFHTVFDQDHELQTSNEMLDLAIGSYAKYNPGTTGANPTDPNYTISFSTSGATAITASVDSSNKPIFGDLQADGTFTHDPNVLMMREKINIYKQYAQILLGDSSSYFTAPYDDDVTNDDDDRINHALFINIKRLFTRDTLDIGKFSMKIGKDAGDGSASVAADAVSTTLTLISDTNASSSLTVTPFGASVGTITDGSNNMGIIFYEQGVIVLDAEKVFDGTQTLAGSISSVSISGSLKTDFTGSLFPHFWVSGSVDNILDHIAETRFGRANTSAMGLINKTTINSTIYFCRVAPNDANFSTNPTYTDGSGSLRCIESKGDDPFAYVTTIGLYDTVGQMLAVAKTSRPIEKNPEVDLSISVRIDY